MGPDHDGNAPRGCCCCLVLIVGLAGFDRIQLVHRWLHGADMHHWCDAASCTLGFTLP